MIEINHAKCTLCEECVSVCPFSALVREGHQIVVTESCRLCQICVKKCPEGAIYLQREDDVKPESRSDSTGVLVVAELSSSGLHPVTFELLGKGRSMADELGQKLYCIVVGENIGRFSQETLDYGVDTCFAYDHPELKHFRIEPYTNAVFDAIKRTNPAIVLCAATPLGRSLAPRVAVRCRTGLTADCTELEVRENGELVQIRPAFGGNIMAQIITPHHRPQMATVRYKVMEPAEYRRMPGARVVHCHLEPHELKSGVRILQSEPKTGQSSISDAEVVVVAGRGLKSKADLHIIEELADLLGGQVGVTRPLVEAGWAEHTRQIGLSGRTIRPKLLITVGVSGAVQFTSSISGAELIVAINHDPQAPIFGVAHYGLVGDLYSIVEELLHELQRGVDHDVLRDNIS